MILTFFFIWKFFFRGGGRRWYDGWLVADDDDDDENKLIFQNEFCFFVFCCFSLLRCPGQPTTTTKIHKNLDSWQLKIKKKNIYGGPGVLVYWSIMVNVIISC